MSGRRRKGLSPSLFPFLAVLVCTLGTLILLLALVAQNASTTAQTQAEAVKKETSAKSEPNQQRQLTVSQAKMLIDEGEFRVEQLVSFREAQTADLEQRRDQLTQVESHMEKIREQLRQLNSEVELATGEEEIESVDHKRLLALQHQLIDEEKSVDKLRAEKSDQLPRVALIPHKGPNGTDRRPVYLECTPTGITIWPEGSTISAGQLEESVTGANPLDAALRVVRHHVMHQYGDAVPPYPLLVVRPNGIETYASARVALSDWDDQFGYELVPAAVKLAYDKPDASLKSRVDDAIRAASIKQFGLNALAKRAGGRGGFTPDGRRIYPRLSAASMDRAGRESGFQDHREGFDRQNLRTIQRNSAQSYGNYSGSGHDSGHGAEAARKLDESMKSAAQEMRTGQQQNGNGSVGQYSVGQYSVGQYSGQYAENPYVGADQPNGSQNGDFENSNGLTASSERTGNTLGTENSDFDTNTIPSMNSGNEAADGAASFSQPGFDQSDSRPTGRPQTNRYLVPSQGTDALGHQYNPHITEQVGAMGSNAANRGPTNSPNGNGQPSGANGSQAANGSSQQSSSQQSNGQQSSSQQASSQQASSQQASSQQSGQQYGGQQSGSSARPSNLSQANPSNAQGQPPPSTQIDRSQNLSATREIVRRQGADWALPSGFSSRGSNSIVRTIRVQCYSDRLVLLGSSRGQSPTEVFGIFDTDMNRATLELASAVRDRIELWGAALPGGRWQPRLDVEVMQGAEGRFYQLQKMMVGGGVEIAGRRPQ